MATLESDFSSPVLLLAMPQVLDPFFHRSVVLLLQHEEEGSLGFIVNRPTGIRIQEILKGMEVDWKGSDDAVAYFGGPVHPQLGSVLFATAGAEERVEAANEILPGLAVTQHVGDLSRLAEEPPDRFRLFLGYAGWSEGQLVQEILRNDWLTAPVRDDLIFARNPEGIWTAALESVGVDPAALPWSGGGDPETAN